MNEWTEIWPAEPGHYWFFGWCSRLYSYAPEIILVEVAKTMNSVAYFGNGHFIYKVAEGAFGFWKKADLPKPPPIEVLREALLG